MILCKSMNKSQENKEKDEHMINSDNNNFKYEFLYDWIFNRNTSNMYTRFTHYESLTNINIMNHYECIKPTFYKRELRLDYDLSLFILFWSY